jgi:hypothetical protein
LPIVTLRALSLRACQSSSICGEYSSIFLRNDIDSNTILFEFCTITRMTTRCDVRFVKERKVYCCLQTLEAMLDAPSHPSPPLPEFPYRHVLAQSHVSPTLRTSSDALFQADSSEPDADLGWQACSWAGRGRSESAHSNVERLASLDASSFLETTIGSIPSLIGVRAVERKMKPHGPLQCIAGQINLRQNIHKKLLLIIFKAPQRSFVVDKFVARDQDKSQDFHFALTIFI